MVGNRALEVALQCAKTRFNRDLVRHSEQGDFNRVRDQRDDDAITQADLGELSAPAERHGLSASEKVVHGGGEQHGQQDDAQVA